MSDTDFQDFELVTLDRDDDEHRLEVHALRLAARSSDTAARAWKTFQGALEDGVSIADALKTARTSIYG